MKEKGINLFIVVPILVIAIIIVIVVGINIDKSEVNLGEITENVDNKIEANKFSIEMLEANGFGENVTIKELEERFGKLEIKSSYSKTSTGENVDEYLGEGIELTFINDKLKSTKITRKDFDINGVKIGDSKDKIFREFYKHIHIL